MNLKFVDIYMKKILNITFAIYLCSWFIAAPAKGQLASLDSVLQRIITEFDVRPIDSKEFYISEKFKLGQALFYDPLLSGNRDVSCSTCHLIDYGLGDGLSLSIGVGGEGKGADRVSVAGRELHPRNSMDLWNRDHNDVSSMFWDGRISVADRSSSVKFRSQLGDKLPSGLENLMAAQSIFPLITPDEMTGYPGDISASSGLPFHDQKPNELAEAYRETGVPILHSEAIFDAIMARLLEPNPQAENNSWRSKYLELFKNAYPSADHFGISHVGNAIAHFIEVAFASRRSGWDSYLTGERQAITNEAKEGAILFFGKGRCAVCHSGETFSDYQFHSIGVLDDDRRISEDQRDVGRYAVTGRSQDLFKFRTPPLRNVTRTSPYFHNGTIVSLFDAVQHHVNPLRNVNRYHESGRFLLTRDQADAVSPLVANGLDLDQREIERIVAFLEALSNTPTESELGLIVPAEVPSGLEFLY